MPRPWTRRIAVAAALAAVTALGATEMSSWGQSAATGTAPRYITDAQGRSLILHGLNTASSAKSAPDGMPDYDEKMVDKEHELLGTNFVRYLIQWRTVEPRPGVYDDAYLDKVAERVGWYRKRGMHVLLDMHQDVYGPETNGNGAPVWATRRDGKPAPSQDPWELGYVQPGTMRAFDHFWNTTGDHPELQRHYVNAWKHVAARFANDPTVIGYDLMNEPWGGSLPGVPFERGPLSNLYQRATNAIRQVDREKWIFIEPRAVGVNWGLASGLRKIDDPRPGDPRIAYAPHLYPLPLDLGSDYVGGDREWTERTFRAWRKTIIDTARRQNAPILLGEYGLDATKPGALDFVRAARTLSDEMGMGQAYWSADPGSWSPWNDDSGRTPSALAPVMARAYPRAVAGTPTLVRYDETTRTLTVRFRADPKITAPTEIWLPADDFPKGGTVTGGRGDWDGKTRVLKVTTPSSGEQTITVHPS